MIAFDRDVDVLLVDAGNVDGDLVILFVFAHVHAHLECFFEFTVLKHGAQTEAAEAAKHLFEVGDRVETVGGGA
ncbi:MAG: hypothetical protein ACREPE_11065 [Lysobacter sp.]